MTPTDLELSRLIAEQLGWEWWTFLGNSFLCSPADSGQFAAHPGLGWNKSRATGKEAFLGEHFVDSSRRPRYQDHPDYVHDPAMTVMLMTLPGFVSVDQLNDEDDKYLASFCGSEKHGVYCVVDVQSALADTPGRAIALAAAKAWRLI